LQFESDCETLAATIDKGTPSARKARKTTGLKDLTKTAGLPKWTSF
jgi:hypothetical protein